MSDDRRWLEIERIMDAAVGAKLGMPGAAEATIRLIADAFGSLRDAEGRLTLLNRTRPADYWRHQ